MSAQSGREDLGAVSPVPTDESADRMVSEAAQHEANRLTDADRDAIVSAMAEYVTSARTAARMGGREYVADPILPIVLERLGWHAIGCGSADLRASELVEIQHLALTAAGDR